MSISRKRRRARLRIENLEKRLVLATVLVVSDAQDPAVAGGNHEDDELVFWLRDLGYDVDTTGMASALREGGISPAETAALEAADLVLVSRRTDSGAYDGDKLFWNQTLTTPLLLQSGFLDRESRWGWHTSDTASDATLLTTAMQVLDADHPFLNGLNGNSIEVFDWSDGPIPGNQAPKAVYNSQTSSLDPAAEVIGTYEGRTFLYEMDAGTVLASGDGQLGGRRVFLGHWGYDEANADYRWDDHLTDGYETIVANIIADLVSTGPATQPVVTNSVATNITATTATIGGEVSGYGGEAPQVTVYYGDNDGGTNPNAWDDYFSLGTRVGPFSTDLSFLSGGTDYYFTAMAENSAGQSWASPSRLFTTESLQAPSVVLNQVFNITSTTAQVSGTVTETGNDATTVIVYYGNEDAGTNAAAWDEQVNLSEQSGPFTTTLGGLESLTTHYVRARASNAAGSTWTSAANFVTGAPSIDDLVMFNDHVAGPLTHVNATSYSANGLASGPLRDISTGDDTPVTLAVNGVGINYAGATGLPAEDTDAYEIFQGVIDFSASTGTSLEIEAANGDSYTHSFQGLDPIKSYDFAGTVIRGNTAYTNRWTLVTLVGADASTPAHSTGAGVVRQGLPANQVALWVGDNSSPGQGFVAQWTDIDPGDDGGFEVVSTQYTGAIPTSVQANGVADGSKGYGLTAIRLTERFNGMAALSSSPSNGQVLLTAPTVAQIDFSLPIDASTLSADDLKVNGNPVATGFTLIDENSVTFQLPALQPDHYTLTVAAGDILSTEATGGLDSIEFRSSFIVLDAPTVTTLSADDITGTSATIGAQLDAGGTTADLVLFWGDEDGGTTEAAWDTRIDLGNLGNGDYTESLENLNPDTPYYFRARAENALQQIWSAATESFSTAVIEPPVVDNTAVSNVGAFSAELGGNVVSTGNQIPQVTLYYGSADGGTDAGAWEHSVDVGALGGAFAVPVDGLTPSATYYYRTFAENLGGADWADASSEFATLDVTAPLMGNDPAENVGPFSAFLHGQVIDVGNDEPLVTVFYGPHDGGTDPNAWTSSVIIGAESDEFSAAVSGLSAETTYYFRARGTNYAGDGWAASTGSFTTTDVPTLRITEFMARNDGPLQTRIRSNPGDPFAGDPMTPDWIEIRNESGGAYNIGGFHLTDEADDPTRWEIPAGTMLQGGDYLLIWASSEDVRDPALDEAGRLHADFGLNDGGEYLAITTSDGTVAHEYAPEFPRQVEDVSYGIDVTGQAKYYRVPTPGALNNESDTFQGFVADTRFSVTRGIFGAGTAPFTTVITTDTPGSVIFYTTNGSEPTTTNGTRVNPPDLSSPPTAEVLISTTTTLRAIAYAPGLEATNVDTQTYVFVEDVLNQPFRPQGFPTGWGGAPAADYEMDPEIVQNPLYTNAVRAGLTSIPTLSVVGNVNDIFGGGGIYSNTNNSNLEVATSAELIYPDGSDGFQIEAGFKVQGGASRNPASSPKHSLSLRFRSVYGEGRLNHPLFPGSPVENFDSLQLRAMYNNSWIHWDSGQRSRGTLIRDQWMRDSLLAMGEMSAGRGSYVNLYINGLFWGVYNMHERQDSAHYAEYFGGQESDYDALNGGRPIDGDNNGDGNPDLISYNAMKATVASRDWEAIQQVLDVDNYIDFTIIQRYGSNNDLKSDGNWRAAGGGPTGAPWRFYSWDGERVLEGVNEGGPGGTADPPGLLNDLMAIEEFRVRFGDRVHQHFFNDGALTPERTAERWQARMDELNDAIVAESARWGDYRRDVHQNSNGPYLFYTKNDFWDVENNRLLTSYFPARSDIVVQQYRGLNLYPNVVAPSFSQHGGVVPSSYMLTMNAPAGTIRYTTDGSDPMDSPTALSLNPGGQVSLVASGPIQARTLSGGQWSALNSAFFTLGQGRLSVTEINYNPLDPTDAELAIDPEFDNDDFEFVELRNTGDDALDLNGVRMTQQNGEGISFEFGTGQVSSIAADQYVLIVKNRAAFEARYGTSLDGSIAGEYSGNLANNGEMLTILDGLDQVIQQFSYNDGDGWPQRADGNGSSLEIVNSDGNYDDGDNWRASLKVNGSPGVDGTGTIESIVVINEVLSHTDVPQTDSIELHNPTGSPVDVSGWWLSDSRDNLAKFQITTPTVIPAGGYVVFNERDHFNPNPYLPVPQPPGPNHFALSGKEGDQVVLTTGQLGNSVPVEFRDDVEFGASFNGQSWGRSPDGSGSLYPMSALTLGSANAAPRVGPLVISEIMYNAPNPDGDGGIDPDALEFVEIFNPTSQPVDLTEWRIEGGVDYLFAAGTVIGAGQALVVLSFDPSDPGNSVSLDDFRTYYGIDAAVSLVGGYSGRLSNEGETIGLYRPDSPPADEPDFTPVVLEDRVAYNATAPWPDSAGDTGNSIHRLDETSLGDEPTNWVASAGTPGSAQLGGLRVLSVGVNEGIPDPPNLSSPQPTSWQSQRSEISRIVVTFNKAIVGGQDDVTLTNLGIDATAGVTSEVDLTDHVTIVGNTLVLEFAAGELEDGVYRMTILESLADQDGNALDGDQDGIPGGEFVFQGSTQNPFYQLNADWSGDGGVSIFDFGTFAYWFGQPKAVAPAYVNLNGDDGISIFDFNDFVAMFGQGVRFPAGLANEATSQASAPLFVSTDGPTERFVADPSPTAQQPSRPSDSPPIAFPATRRLPGPRQVDRVLSGGDELESLDLERILDEIAVGS